jgi:hypothetical protein
MGHTASIHQSWFTTIKPSHPMLRATDMTKPTWLPRGN